MATSTPNIASPRLRRLAQRRSEPTAADPERCELCGEPIAARHRHLLELETRQLLCACRACALLFDRSGAGGGRYRPVPTRLFALDQFELSDLTWEQLRIPVDMAFFWGNSSAGRVMAFYPGPMGATESRLELGAWREIEAANPVLETMQPDVEALLIDRTRGARRQWLVPIDECYALVAVIRTRWRGFGGGKDVWAEIDRFFAELDNRAEPTSRQTLPRKS
jgi:hypothetical protein